MSKPNPFIEPERKNYDFSGLKENARYLATFLLICANFALWQYVARIDHFLIQSMRMDGPEIWVNGACLACFTFFCGAIIYNQVALNWKWWSEVEPEEIEEKEREGQVIVGGSSTIKHVLIWEFQQNNPESFDSVESVAKLRQQPDEIIILLPVVGEPKRYPWKLSSMDELTKRWGEILEDAKAERDSKTETDRYGEFAMVNGKKFRADYIFVHYVACRAALIKLMERTKTKKVIFSEEFEKKCLSEKITNLTEYKDAKSKTIELS